MTEIPSDPPDSGDSSAESPRHRSHPLSKIRNTFVTGLMVVMPLVATLFLLGLALDFINLITVETFNSLGLRPLIPEKTVLGVKVVPLVIMLAVIFLAGMFAAHAIGRRFFKFCDSLVLRVPLVSTIYSASKQVAESLRGIEGLPNFQYVVYLEYPAPGCHLIGFVTGKFIEPGTGKSITTVFLPTSPSPITGFVVAVDSEMVKHSSLSVEDATKLVVSGGLVGPIYAGKRTAPGVLPPPTPVLQPAGTFTDIR